MTDDPVGGAWYAQWEQRQQQERLETDRALAAVCERLSRLGVELASAAFDGSDDNGVFEDPVALRSGRLVPLPPELREELLDRFAEQLPSGWSVNQGSSGEIVLVINAARCICHHRRRAAPVPTSKAPSYDPV